MAKIGGTIRRRNWGIEWRIGALRAGAGVYFSHAWEDDLMIHLSIPLLLTVYFWINHWPAVYRLPGVRSGAYGTGQRTLALDFHHWAIWWKLWVHEDNMAISDGWRRGSFYPLDWLLGAQRPLVGPRRTVPAAIELPEGYYAAIVDLYRMEWRRPRWPFATGIDRADVTIPHGIPIPDDRLYSMTTPAKTAGEAVEAMRRDVLRSRGCDDWAPASGWPQHCVVR